MPVVSNITDLGVLLYINMRFHILIALNIR